MDKMGLFSRTELVGQNDLSNSNTGSIGLPESQVGVEVEGEGGGWWVEENSFLQWEKELESTRVR